MEFVHAEPSHASIIQHVMQKAFKDTRPRSSALDETIEEISTALQRNEQAIITYHNNVPIAVVRFTFFENTLYFFRLSVLPNMQGQGVAKQLLAYLENLAEKKQGTAIVCKVRASIPKNVQLYEKIGFTIRQTESVQKNNGEHLIVVTMQKELGGNESC